MFIVVAIVIFGIFVVLANTLFGSEGLSNDLKSLFENAIEKSTSNGNNYFKANPSDVQKCIDMGYSGKTVEDENYTYTFNEDCTEITISQYKHSFVEQDVVVIPESYLGIPITKTENLIRGTYEYDSLFTFAQVKKVVLPDTITEIGSFSFNYGILEDINFPKGLKVVGKQAFDKTNLGDVKLPDGLEIIDYMAFRHAHLTSINIPSTVTSIGARAFSGYNYIDEYHIPETVTNVDYGAFNSEDSRKVIVYYNSEYTKLHNINAFGTDSATNTNMTSFNGTIYDTKTGSNIDVTIRENIK